MHGPNQAKKKIVHFNGIRKIEFSKKKIKKEIMKIWIQKKSSEITIFLDAGNGSLLRKP